MLKRVSEEKVWKEGYEMKEFIKFFISIIFCILVAMNVINFETKIDNAKSVKELFEPETLGRIVAQIVMTIVFIYAAYEILN